MTFFSFCCGMWPLEWKKGEENALGWQPTACIPEPATLSNCLWLGLNSFLYVDIFSALFLNN